MKSKLSLKNLAKRGLLVNFIFLLSFFISGCTISTEPTYLKEDIPKAVQDICKNEYKIGVKAKLVGSTLWVYLPLEDLLIKSDKPERYIEKFAIEENKSEFKERVFSIEYQIKAIPEEEKFQEYRYNKDALDKINDIWKVLRRVLFSMERTKRSEPNFFCIVAADIKNAFEVKEIFYYLDFKKVSYGFISWNEYQHRTINETVVLPSIIGDEEGLHLEYKDINMEEFIAAQIKNRIKLKFQKPEVDKNADIDKEILKIITYTINIYGFKDFQGVESYNLLSKNRIILNSKAVLAGPTE
jgi:hypothetical protein